MIFVESTAKVPSGLRHKRAFVRQVIELQRHALAVRLMHAEAQRAELTTRETSCRADFSACRQQLVIEQILEHEQAGHIRLGLFDRRMQFLQRLAARRFAARCRASSHAPEYA